MGPAGFGGAGCPGAEDVDAAGFAAAGVPGVADAAGFGGAAGAAALGGSVEGVAAGTAAFGGVVGVEVSDGGEGLTGVVVVSDWTEPEGVAFSPPGLAGWSAIGLGSFPGGVGDLGSSAYLAKANLRRGVRRKER